MSTAGLFQEPDVALHSTAMKYLWMVHIRGCLRRDLPNLIKIADYAAFTKMPCHYCGSPPTNWTKLANHNIQYNGVDRVDNTRPYEIGNIVPCCKLCNAMKSNLTADTFKRHVIVVATFLTNPAQPMTILRETSRPASAASVPGTLTNSNLDSDELLHSTPGVPPGTWKWRNRTRPL